MSKIIMLGTGNGGTLDLYNTCFLIQNKDKNFLVDTGGSIEIIKRLKQINVDIKDIHHIFISHQHMDHLLGLIWMFKKLGRAAINGQITQKINIYCNDKVYEAIKGVSSLILQKKLVDAIYDSTNFVILKDKDGYEINDVNYTFFDIHAKGDEQFGFECKLNDKKLIFLGDETINPILNDRVRNADYVMHESFCLDSEENIFHAYEKNHSTAKSVANVMNELNVKNLILYHTEESHKENKKELYEKEAKEVFDGNVIVPNDMEEIEI